MSTKHTLKLLRKYGTGTTVRALLSPKRFSDAGYLSVLELVEKQTELLADLITLLEKKKVLRRGHVLELLSKLEE